MIFIIIAVVVLFVSFVIALISLVNEQRKIEKADGLEIGQHVDGRLNHKNVPEVESTLIYKPETIMADVEAEKQSQEPKELLEEHEDRFPWEVEPKIPNVSNSEQDEIERIRSEIARMHKPADVQEEATHVPEQQDNTDTKSDDVRLSGEFQIRRDN